MILLGLAVDPFRLAPHLPSNSFSINALENDKKNALFIGTKAFTRLRIPSASQRIMIFDIKDRTETLQGLVYIPDIDPVKAWEAIRRQTKSIPRTGLIAQRNIIQDLIEKNKDKSVIHLFNTNLYKIKSQPIRILVRDLYLAFLNNTITREEFDKRIQERYPRKGESKDAVDTLMTLTTTSQFQILHQALKEVKKEGLDAVDAIALKYKLESFDLNYLIANREKKADG